MQTATRQIVTRPGALALEYGKQRIQIEVLRSGAGYYIGTQINGEPNSRESNEYFRTKEEAENALATDGWTQKEYL